MTTSYNSQHKASVLHDVTSVLMPICNLVRDDRKTVWTTCCAVPQFCNDHRRRACTSIHGPFLPSPPLRDTPSHIAYFAHCNQAYLARCDFLRVLHVFTILYRYDSLLWPCLCLLPYNPRTGLKVRKENNLHFSANGIFKIQNPWHDCQHNLYDYLAVPRLRLNPLHS